MFKRSLKTIKSIEKRIASTPNKDTETVEVVVFNDVTFCFSLTDIPFNFVNDQNIHFTDISELRYLVDGSNSNVSKGKLKKVGPIILKLIKKDITNKLLVESEFDAEHQVLYRMQ